MRRLPLLALALAVACTSIHVHAHKSILAEQFAAHPVPQEEVHVFLADDSIPDHTRVAILRAEAVAGVSLDSVVSKFRQEAGKLGANAIILEWVHEVGTTEVVTCLLGGGCFCPVRGEMRGQAVAVHCPSLARQ